MQWNAWEVDFHLQERGLRAELWVGLVFSWCCCTGLLSPRRVHIGAAGGEVNGATVTNRQWTKSVSDNVFFCSQTKEGADVLSFLEDSFVLVVIRLDALFVEFFSSRRVLVRVDVLSLDHYWLFIVL